MNRLSTEQYLLQLKASDVQVWLEGERVRVSVPKDVVVPDLREELTARKDEIVAFLKQVGRHAVATSAPPLQARDGHTDTPLSFGQQRVWLLHEINKDQASPYDTLTWSPRLRGRLDVDALQRSLNEIQRRHEVLRTTFHLGAEAPVQVVEPTASLMLEEADLHGLSADAREAALQQQLREAKETLFDLAHGPLFRARLIRLDESDHALVLLMHHIVFDAWSMDILTRELAQLYECFAAGRPSPLPALPVQYGDFAVWQRQWLQGEALAAQIDYWRPRLDGLATLDLPLDHPRPPVQTYAGAKVSLRVPDGVSAALIELGKANGVTPFMILLAALGVLLSRYTGQTDIAIGTPITNRDRDELQQLIGYFLNTLVMRVDLASDPAFVDLLAQVRRTVLDAFAHQHLPFEVLVEQLKLERYPSRSPLFQVLFVMQNFAESAPLALGGLDVSALGTAGDTSRFDLEFYVYQDAGGFSASCVYNPDLFEADTIQRMLGHYGNVLAAVAYRPEQRVGQIALLGEQERRQLLVEWNATAHDFPDSLCLHQLIEAQALRTPEDIAVSDGAQQLSYRELDARANRLACVLRAQGVATGDLVGICAERSVALVAGLLGILKAGAAYLPLDVAHPRERLAGILADAGAQVVVSESHLEDALPAHAVSVWLDGEDVRAASQAPPVAVAPLSPAATAYVIYTSGSTGKPKGVRVPHRGVVNFLHAMRRQPGIAAGDVLLAVTTVSFDIHVLEIFLPLVAGAQVRLVDRETAADGQRLLALLQSSGATLMQATPTTWRMLIEAGWMMRLPLKVLCGGEALPPDLARQLAGRCGELWNMYGPTETTVWSSVYRVNAAETIIPVGHPIDNTRFYILDAQREPVPVGVTGELYIGGDGVTDGYVNRPELTAERFVADPFDNTPSARLYRTGDIARYLADGNVQVIGRVDHQVKLRGFRIELGEIEAALLEHPEVAATVVVLDTHAEPRLVAYAVPQSAARPATTELREFLRDRLPYYMILAIVVWLDALPLTGSGKIDRKALPAPSRTVERAPQPALAPSGELETALARIWSELLEIDDIQASDTFFDLGGHSLLSLKVVERFERETGRHIRPVDLVNQTLGQIVAGLASRDASRTATGKTARPPGLLQSIKGAFSRGS